MQNFLNSENMFIDKSKADILAKYSEEILLLKEIIEIVENSVSASTDEVMSFEGVCDMFASSVLSNTQIAYNNLCLGHLSTVYSIARTILESNICLDIIIGDKEKILWKYYLFQSVRNSLKYMSEELSDEQNDLLKDMFDAYEISEEFLKERGNMPPFADRNYGWTYPINRRFTFKGLCDLVNQEKYDEFKFMSEFSHASLIGTNLTDFAYEECILNIVSLLCWGLQRLVDTYCKNTVAVVFFDLAKKLNKLVIAHLDEQ